MTTRIPALRRPPIAFAHRGASADAPENTLEAFALALELGATGLESDVWITADGQAVLDHDGVAGRWPRRRSIRSLRREALPAHVLTLDELYAECGTDFDLSLDVKDAAAFDRIVEVTRAAGLALDRLWLCHPDWRQVAEWRDRDGDVRLVDSTRLRRIKEGPERRAATLAKSGIDAVDLHRSDWTGGLTTLFHRFDVLAFAWDAQHTPVIDELVDAGVDAVYGDHVDRLVDSVSRAYPED